MQTRSTILWVPFTISVVSAIFLILGIVNFWFGEAREGIMLFCEHAREGFIKQPSNSFSNLGFVFFGLLIAWLAYQNRFTNRNRMTRTYFYPIMYSSIVVLLGIGSFAMHATNGAWGGFFDLLSMFLFSTFVFSYALMRWFRLSKTVFFRYLCCQYCFGELVIAIPLQ